MGHCIRAIIGTHRIIQKLETDWGNAKEIELPQGYGMVFLTDEFSDDVTEIYGVSDELYCHELVYFTAAIARLLQQYTHNTKLAYVETDYFGGTGTQGGVLYDNGQISIAPRSSEGTINILLRELGVRCEPNKDEFDRLNLGIYRRMDE